MQLETVRPLSRRQFLCGCCAGAATIWVPTLACAAEQVVPTSLEPRHHRRLENEYLRVLEVIIEPGDATLFHEHSLDFSLVTIQGAELKNEVPNSAEAAIVRLDTNAVRYTNYQGRPYIHRVTNLSRDRFVLISFEILSPETGRFDVSDRREAPLYASELDNNRVRAWRLKLEPGQSVPPILQSGPGLRVFLNGDQIMETVSGAPEREIRFKRGDFEWQPPAMTRALRNTGTRPVELVDFELR